MNDLLDRAIEAHGGMARWNAIEGFDVVFNYSGALLDLKGYPGHHQVTMSVDAHAPRAVIQRMGDEPDDRWIFTRDRVWIERRDGSIVMERSDPRAAFAGHTRDTPWDELHLTYFLGYAMWNYLCVPFLFAGEGFSTRELAPHQEGGETWRVLEVTYPDGIPAHCKVQSIYFDEAFQQKRLDYTTDVLGGVGAHYTYDNRTVSGIVTPMLRRVVKRTPDKIFLNANTSFLLDYVDLRVRER